MSRHWDEDLHGWIPAIMMRFLMRQILWRHSRNARDYIFPASKKLHTNVALLIKNSF